MEAEATTDLMVLDAGMFIAGLNPDFLCGALSLSYGTCGDPIYRVLYMLSLYICCSSYFFTLCFLLLVKQGGFVLSFLSP